MSAGNDEIVATAVKRQHEPQRVVGDLLTAELSEKQARSIKYQRAIARMPFAKEIDEFTFEDTPVNETLGRDLAGGVRRGARTGGALAPHSSSSSAISCWSAARARAKRTLPSASCAPALEGGSSTSSIS
jgi:hypothetical protein